MCLAIAVGACAEPPAPNETRSLPPPGHRGASFEEILTQRRSVRSFEGALTRAEVSALLHAAQGVTGVTYGRPLRAAPSAGGTYPFTLYTLVNDVDGIAPGLYRYLPDGHTLETVREGRFGAALRAAALDQRSIEEAGIVIVMAARPERTTGRYGERGIRYIHMEAGHISQNIYLQAVSLGLGSVAVGAFDDRQAARVLDLPPPEQVLYLHPVGRPRQRPAAPNETP